VKENEGIVIKEEITVTVINRVIVGVVDATNLIGSIRRNTKVEAEAVVRSS
jgi:hypothetical protein